MYIYRYFRRCSLLFPVLSLPPSAGPSLIRPPIRHRRRLGTLPPKYEIRLNCRCSVGNSNGRCTFMIMTDKTKRTAEKKMFSYLFNVLSFSEAFVWSSRGFESCRAKCRLGGSFSATYQSEKCCHARTKYQQHFFHVFTSTMYVLSAQTQGLLSAQVVVTSCQFANCVSTKYG